jgi:hypothetical protein
MAATENDVDPITRTGAGVINQQQLALVHHARNETKPLRRRLHTCARADQQNINAAVWPGTGRDAQPPRRCQSRAATVSASRSGDSVYGSYIYD